MNAQSSKTENSATTEVAKAAPKPGPAKKATPAKAVKKAAAPAGARTKAVAKKAPAKAPAKKAPAKKVAAKKVVPPADRPTWAGAIAQGKGKAFEFRQTTLRVAGDLGYKPTPGEGPFADRVVTFVKGAVRVTVTYSAQDFVRKVEVGGREVIKKDDSDKYKKLNAMLASLAAKAAKAQ